MNRAIHITFLTPYVSSIARDQDYLHIPLPLDGALAHAVYWRALTEGRVAWSSTGNRADPTIMKRIVRPELDAVLGSIHLGHGDLLKDRRIGDRVYLVSSGFPVHEGQVYIKYGARWVQIDGEASFIPQLERQPLRKRVDRNRFDYLDLDIVTERGRPGARVEWGKGAVKPIDNKITTWRVFHYVWFAQVRDETRLDELLEVLKFQGMGKKHTAGFGRIANCWHERIEHVLPPAVEVKRRLFLEREGELVLLRPVPYDAIMMATRRRIVMTNMVVESGCGYRPPYWSDRRVVVREGTVFSFHDVS
jgi:hypothetical protein